MKIAVLVVVAACASQPRMSVNIADQRLVTGPSPSVAAVADADAPLFYHRDAWWLFHDGAWYTDYRHQWIRIASPPTPLLAIGEPERYVHYRPSVDSARL